MSGWRTRRRSLVLLFLAGCYATANRPSASSPRSSDAKRGDPASHTSLPLRGDPSVTRDVNDCVCKGSECSWPCTMQGGEIGIQLADPNFCGMALPCWVSEKRLLAWRAQAESSKVVPLPEPLPSPPCVVATDPPRLSAYEVTVREYRRCVDAHACTLPKTRHSNPADWSPQFQAAMRDENRAVTGVTRADAAAYCAFVGARLPSSAEWLAAARADCHKFPWGDSENVTFSNCLSSEAGRPIRPPGSFPRDVVRGIYDLHGNVSEWTADGRPHGVPYCVAPLGAIAESEEERSDGVGFRCMAKPR